MLISDKIFKANVVSSLSTEISVNRCKASVLFANIRLGWKCLTVTNGLAYFGKGFVGQVQSSVEALQKHLPNIRTQVKKGKREGG